MNLYTRARKHIDMSRVKEIREQNKEKKLLQEYNKRKELAALRDKHNPEYSNWRGNVTEGMNTGNVYFTTLPATGETNLETISTQTSDSFEDAGGNDAFEKTVVKGSGSGSGSNGGFAIGSHLAFQGDGAPRWAILKPIDSSKFDTLTINAIRGNDTNGGEDPDLPGEELRLYYLPPGGSAFRSVGVNQQGQQVMPADFDVIIPVGKDDSGLTDYSVTLPSYARGVAFRYMLYQLSNDGVGFDNYGIKNVKYQRKAPISVFISLDSPEASSFINDGSGGLSPEEKKKRLTDMLAASDEYQSRQFPFNKAAYEKAAKDVARNIQISLDPNTFDFPDDPITIDKLFNTKITDSSSDEDLDRYLEQRGLSIDTLTKDNINRSFNSEKEKLQVINNSSIENRDKFLTAMGINVNDIKNLSNDTYRKIRDAGIYIRPGGTPSTGWNGKFYSFNDPQLEASRIVPTETYLKAKEDPNWYGTERPDIALPGTRYVLEKPYSFSSNSDARPVLTGPQNETFKQPSEDARRNIYRIGTYGDLGFTWDLNHFERGMGSGDQRLAPGSNFAREQVVESMTVVLNHLYDKSDELAYAYANEYGIDTTSKYDPAYFLLNDDRGRRALEIASNSNARDLDYPRSSFGKDGEDAYRRHLIGNDRTVEEFQLSLNKIKSLSTDFKTYDNDEWYINTKVTGGHSVGNPLKAHPYSGLPEPDPITSGPDDPEISDVSDEPTPAEREAERLRELGVSLTDAATAREAQRNKQLEKNIKDSLKQLEIDNEQLKGESFKRNLALAAQLGLDILTVVTLLTPIPGDEALALSAQAAKTGVTVGAKTAAQRTTIDAFRRALTSPRALSLADDAIRAGGPGATVRITANGKTGTFKAADILKNKGFNLPRIQGQGGSTPRTPQSGGSGGGVRGNDGRMYSNQNRADFANRSQDAMRNLKFESYESKAKHNDKVAKVTSRLKSVSDFINHADVKPVFPKDPPPEMINGRHPDLVDGEKVSNRYNRLDPISAKAMPKTGNPKIDSKVLKALKKRK